MVLQKKQNIERRINQKEEDNLIDKVEQVEEKKLQKVVLEVKVHGEKILKL